MDTVKPDRAELEQLEVLAGRWRTEGRNALTAPSFAGARITGTESWEWLAGGFFLVGTWMRRFEGGGEHAGLSVIGPDARGATLVQNFDNLGFARTYALSIRERTWTLAGEHERATYTFDPRGERIRVSWERSADDRSWRPLCDLEFERE